MTRKEKIEDLKNQICLKQKEISELENKIISERIDDFYEKHNLAEGQHFLYKGKECVGVELNEYYSLFRTHRINKNGNPSAAITYIYDERRIKPI